MSRLTRRAEADGVKAVWYGNREVFLEGEPGYAEADKLARFEDIEEVGMVYEVFYFKPYERWDKCKRLALITDAMDLGKNVFLTKAEAEAKLAELKGE